MKYLFLLLRRNVSAWQLLIFGVGGLVGALIVMLCMQSYRDIDRAYQSDDALFSENYLVISKPVSLRTTVKGLIGGQSLSFNEHEIEELRALPDVSEVAPFRTARFTVDAMVSAGHRTLRTEMFLESVPDEFIDLPLDDIEWKADLSDRFVPVLVPRNYLDLYNFGYASARGLPQLAEGLVGQFTFQLIIGGSFYHARIVGFSTRLNTILVPDAFLADANRVYGEGKDDSPSRLIVRTRGEEAGASLLQYLTRMHYVVADGGEALVRMRSMVYGIVWAVAAVGILVMLLSFFLLVVSFLLLIERNREIFRNLISLGYNQKQITRPYRLLALVVDVIVWAVAALLCSIFYPYIGALILEASPSLQPAGMGIFYLAAFIGCLVFVLIHYTVIWYGVKRITKR